MKFYRVKVEEKTGPGFEKVLPVWGWESYQNFLELDPGVAGYSVEGPVEIENEEGEK